jgi:hypothetical protein
MKLLCDELRHFDKVQLTMLEISVAVKGGEKAATLTTGAIAKADDFSLQNKSPVKHRGTLKQIAVPLQQSQS